MNKPKLWASLSLLAVLLLTSCASRKSFVYLQDMQMGEKYPYDAGYEAVVHRDDRLSITVSCKNPELAIPFNIYGGTFHVGADGNVTADAATRVNEKGYRVDVEGNIDFPILGKLHVEGLKVSEVTNLIKTRLIEGDYMKDPLVSIEFLNFKYTVLGAVANNGTFTVDGDRVTLLEAIAKAGDLDAKARTNRVAVIRESNGERQMFMHDLRSKDLFDSPCLLPATERHRLRRAEVPEEGQRGARMANRHDHALCSHGCLLDHLGNEIVSCHLIHTHANNQ